MYEFFLFLSNHLVFTFVFFGFLLFFLGFLIGKIQAAKGERKIRKDAVNRSRAVIGGQVAEQLAPFLPGFPCNPADCRFVGKPVDFVVFSGLSEKNKVSEIVFVEVKTGNSSLSDREKQVKECVQKGNIRYEEYRI